VPYTNSDYTSLASVKASLDISETTFDTDIALCVTAASRMIDQLGGPGRTFYPYYTGTLQFLPENNGYCIIYDCSSFTSLVAQNSTWTLGSDFYLEPINAAADGIPYTAIRTIARPFIFTKAEISPGGWAAFDGRISVTGTFGFASVPEPIQTAASLLAARLFNRIRQSPYGSGSLGDEAAAYRLGDVDPDVLNLVEPYSRGSLIS